MTNTAELADYQWLAGSEAAGMLVDLAGRSEPVHTAVARLRRCVSPVRAHLLLEQVELRRRAAAKFDRAAEMFFTRLGLEQATDQWVAAHKALRFEGRGAVADLCCGIGGDLLALAAHGPAMGVDHDSAALCLAEANAHVHGVAENLRLAETDVEDFADSGVGAWHVDPDRRPDGNRTSSPEWSSPGVESIARMLAANPQGAIKLAPAAEPPTDWGDRCELEWISRDRQCRQLVAWHGGLAERPGECRATILAQDGGTQRAVVGQPEQPMPYTNALGRFLFEPDPAVLAARLTGVLADEHRLSAISAGIAYLTGPTAVDDPALACFEVREILPLDLRQIAAHLRAQDVGRLEIKKRGVEHDPATVRKQLHLSGDEVATLFLTKLNGKHAAILARRIHPSETLAHATRL